MPHHEATLVSWLPRLRNRRAIPPRLCSLPGLEEELVKGEHINSKSESSRNEAQAGNPEEPICC